MFLLYRAYETLSNPNKRRVYDATGMSANDQQNSEFTYEGFSTFNQFMSKWMNANDDEESMQNKSYEEIL